MTAKTNVLAKTVLFCVMLSFGISLSFQITVNAQDDTPPIYVTQNTLTAQPDESTEDVSQTAEPTSNQAVGSAEMTNTTTVQNSNLTEAKTDTISVLTQFISWLVAGGFAIIVAVFGGLYAIIMAKDKNFALRQAARDIEFQNKLELLVLTANENAVRHFNIDLVKKLIQSGVIDTTRNFGEALQNIATIADNVVDGKPNVIIPDTVVNSDTSLYNAAGSDTEAKG
jgi:hypothetical protein